jgi:hypothetical protein
MAVAAGLISNDAQRVPVLALALGSLPTLIHVLAFSLLAGALNARTPASHASICATWAGINALFEIGQNAVVARLLAAQLDRWCGAMTACVRASQYFIRGTFDWMDIVAGTLGGVLAYKILSDADRHAES